MQTSIVMATTRLVQILRREVWLAIQQEGQGLRAGELRRVLNLAHGFADMAGVW